ncbi:MAG: hypothetical protein FWC64_06900 [Treponema sp.]|nr:hypothetical protein [Treponema sp.]
MPTEQEKIETPVRMMIEALGKCPQAINPNIGGEALAKEIVKGAETIGAYLYAPPRTTHSP